MTLKTQNAPIGHGTWRWAQQPWSVSPEKQPDLAQEMPQKPAEKPCAPLSNFPELTGLLSASRHTG